MNAKQTPLASRISKPSPAASAAKSTGKSQILPKPSSLTYNSLSEDEIEELREAFNLFDTEGTGKIDPKELRAAMQSLGFENKNPTIFNLIVEMDKEEFSAGLTFEQFLNAVGSKLGDKETQEGIDRIFDLFDDDKTGTINIRNMKRVSKELGEALTEAELKEILARAASNGQEITREDFYNIMTKKTFA